MTDRAQGRHVVGSGVGAPPPDDTNEPTVAQPMELFRYECGDECQYERPRLARQVDG